jgi:hypothetical protein
MIHLNVSHYRFVIPQHIADMPSLPNGSGFGLNFRFPEWHRESPEFFRFFDDPSYLLTLLAQISLLTYFQLTQFTATSRVTSCIISLYCKQLQYHVHFCVFIIRLIKWLKIVK